jgi:hypothetical protein
MARNTVRWVGSLAVFLTLAATSGPAAAAAGPARPAAVRSARPFRGAGLRALAVCGLASSAVRAAACGSTPARRPGSWGRAIEVPGLGALSKGGDAWVLSLSCGSAGSCAAGGAYTDRHHHTQGFVAAERHGRWGTAIGVPGPVSSVSCPSAGTCAAVGVYGARRGHSPMFVVSLRHGRWGKAIEVPGLGTLDKGGAAGVTSVSCAPAGSCAAGGDYTDRRGIGQGFVASERDGRWGKAIEVPGLAALNKGGNAKNEMSAEVFSVSCGSAGSCAAGGDYWDRRGHDEGFVAVERDGRWGTAIEVPGLAALNQGGDGAVFAVSCGSAGSCAAGGDYNGSGFVASERDGRWGKAIAVPGLAALNTGEYAAVVSVSCGSAGTCAAGGYYYDRHHHSQAFVAAERDGRWGTAIGVPGLGILNAGGGAGVSSVSCAPAGTCAAGGSYAPRHFRNEGFVVSQT